MRLDTLVVFDGQSLNNQPSAGAASMPAKVMAGRGLPWCNVALGNRSWTVLASGGTGTSPATVRLHPLARSYVRSILVMNGGATDIAGGAENDSGAQALADFEAYATAARTAGFDSIIGVTMTTAVVFATGDDDEQRLIYNDGIRASATVDAVADVAAAPELADYTDTTYFDVDQTHWSAAGATVAAAIVGAALDVVL